MALFRGFQEKGENSSKFELDLNVSGGKTVTLEFSIPGNTKYFLVLVKQYNKIVVIAKTCLFSYVVPSQQGKRSRLICLVQG